MISLCLGLELGQSKIVSRMKSVLMQKGAIVSVFLYSQIYGHACTLIPQFKSGVHTVNLGSVLKDQ